ncbi:MAG: hypothetical protein L3J89_08125 [Gammaproteobacteria bacterium]|nr:hypothetical protein [Gammaproteobacteria bacterium]
MISSEKRSQQASDFSKPTQVVEVVAMEMITAVGGNAVQTAAAVRAGINGYQASSVYNKQLNPMTLALVPDGALPPLDDEVTKLSRLTSRQKRMLQLATHPLQQLLELHPLQAPVPLMLAVPEKLPGRRSVVSDQFLTQLKQQTGAAIDLKNSYLFPYGRAAGFHAIEAAIQLIEQGVSRSVIVGAVDSYFDLFLLNMLDREDRVLAEGVMDGFAPGEGAAFIVLQATTDESKIKLYPPGIAEEVGHRYSSEVYKGDGLAEAVSEALLPLAGEQVKTVLAGFNGEHFNAKEWGVSAIRNSQGIASEHGMFHPADSLGDAGAALGLILVQLGIIGVEKGYYKGPVMAWSSSEFAPRGAVCIA